MIRISETTRILPFHQPVPLTDLPLIYRRDHLFPYTSYDGTATTAVPREWRMVVLENDALRIEVAPELGGRVYSLFDKRIGQEILFSNPVVKPVRIPPIGGFISGGIEFNFPGTHSPTSLAEVGCATGRAGDYGFIRVGEREARTGMEWVVELGLVADQAVLVQRSAFRNHSGAPHPWMSWTITAMRSTEDTEFVHPPHRVSVHDHRLLDCDWPGEGLNWERQAREMTAYGWMPGGPPAFGAFHHELGFGLMHLADPAQLPGRKVWTYGHGEDRQWGQDTTVDGLCYCEIESGPPAAPGQTLELPDNAEHRTEEYWIPVLSRSACDAIDWPQLDLPPLDDNAWLGWQHSDWQCEWEKFRTGNGPLPASPVPTGIELESALQRELQRGNPQAAEPLALWLAFRDRPHEALRLVEKSPAPTAQRLAGLILWHALGDATSAVPHLEAGPLDDPIAIAELDTLYAELGVLAKRAPLLARPSSHRLVIERRAHLALALGQPRETLRLLTETPWPRELQRYTRSDLWRAAMAALGEENTTPPVALGEDRLFRG